MATVTPEQQDASFLPPLGTLLQCFIYLYLLVKVKSLQILAELNLGLSDILQSSIFSCTHIIHLILITYSMNYAPKHCTT